MNEPKIMPINVNNLLYLIRNLKQTQLFQLSHEQLIQMNPHHER